MPKKGIDIPKDVADKIVKDGEAMIKNLQPIRDELDKLPSNHSKEDAFEALLTGIFKMMK